MLGIPLYGRNWVVGTTGTCPATAEGNISQSLRDIEDLAVRRGATPVFDPATQEWTFTYDLVVEDGTTSCTQQREVHYVAADGAQIRMQRAVDAGFGGVSLFALGYEDDAVWGPSTPSPPSWPPATATSTTRRRPPPRERPTPRRARMTG